MLLLRITYTSCRIEDQPGEGGDARLHGLTLLFALELRRILLGRGRDIGIDIGRHLERGDALQVDIAPGLAVVLFEGFVDHGPLHTEVLEVADRDGLSARAELDYLALHLALLEGLAGPALRGVLPIAFDPLLDGLWIDLLP